LRPLGPVLPSAPVANVQVPQAAPTTTPARRDNPARAAELTTFGERLFRAGNFTRAVARFEQALKADPNSIAARIGLAQVAVQRGDYREAANRLREAQAADPAWLTRAPDVQTLYLEPRDFANHVGKIETHLQAHPEDRDAWLVLGEQWLLSGRKQAAADIFLRLTDRAPDETLAALLSASQAR
jgi:Tfp pilus assembly protein PilF